MNHDTQPYQTLAANIQPFFKPLAYCLILLRAEGYPCVFYGDVYGIQGDHPLPPSCGGKVPDLCLARKLYSYGEQLDYFDFPQCIGWTRLGTWDRPSGLACIMSSAGPNEKWMYVGQEHRGEIWTDMLGWKQGQVIINDDGWGCFSCAAVSVAVWVNQSAEGRDQLGRL